jgi:hypothetical protein
MRNAEAHVTLGVVAVQERDIERAVPYGQQVLEGDHKSLPSLLMVSQELATALDGVAAKHPDAADYLDRLRQLRTTAA